MNGKKIITLILSVVLFAGSLIQPVKAESFVLNGSRKLDTVFYANYYPDLRARYGYDTEKLLKHYLNYGIFEGRIPSAIYLNNVDLLAIGELVPCEFICQNKSSIFKKSLTSNDGYCATDAYCAAAPYISSLIGQSRTSQLEYIRRYINGIINSSAAYTVTEYHYNDPCGVFGCSDPDHKLGASCAGVTRATGMCLSMLAIPYEHVNENKWAQQWCRVNINGTYWVLDPYLNVCCPEPAGHPYWHPLVP